jgi:undecaprenyl diphosphate synthase
LPASLREAIRIAEEATADHEMFFLNVAVGYGGRQEVVDAVKGLLRAIRSYQHRQRRFGW